MSAVIAAIIDNCAESLREEGQKPSLLAFAPNKVLSPLSTASLTV